MPLIVDQLPLWTIGFKWAGLDADRPWFRIPAPVKDTFSTLLEAILKDHLGCMTLMTQKWDGQDPEVAPFYIRHWIDDIYAGIQLQRFNRKLLRHAVIDRSEFKDWCERCTIPLPEFWFPAGWTDFRHTGDDEGEWADTTPPDPDPPPDAAVALVDVAAKGAVGGTSLTPSDPRRTDELSGVSVSKEPRPSHRARIACQVIATNIWRMEPDKTIASMCKDDRLKLGDADHYNLDITVKRWLQEVAPAPVSARRGRPRKKSPPESDSE